MIIIWLCCKTSWQDQEGILSWWFTYLKISSQSWRVGKQEPKSARLMCVAEISKVYWLFQSWYFSSQRVFAVHQLIRHIPGWCKLLLFDIYHLAIWTLWSNFMSDLEETYFFSVRWRSFGPEELMVKKCSTNKSPINIACLRNKEHLNSMSFKPTFLIQTINWWINIVQKKTLFTVRIKSLNKTGSKFIRARLTP